MPKLLNYLPMLKLSFNTFQWRHFPKLPGLQFLVQSTFQNIGPCLAHPVYSEDNSTVAATKCPYRHTQCVHNRSSIAMCKLSSSVVVGVIA